MPRARRTLLELSGSRVNSQRDFGGRRGAASALLSRVHLVPRLEPGRAHLVQKMLVICFEPNVLIIPEEECERPVQRIDAGAVPHVAILPRPVMHRFVQEGRDRCRCRDALGRLQWAVVGQVWVVAAPQLMSMYAELAALNASRRIRSFMGGPGDCSSFFSAFANRLSFVRYARRRQHNTPNCRNSWRGNEPTPSGFNLIEVSRIARMNESPSRYSSPIALQPSAIYSTRSCASASSRLSR